MLPPPSPPPTTAVIVSDAHLAGAHSDASLAFHRFLEAVPDLGAHLVVNGDLFDFWFEYGTVIPRDAFPTLARLAALQERGVELTVTGGNHDRWGGRFWTEELGARFFSGPTELTLAGWRVFLAHGDGVAEQHLGGRAVHWLTRRRLPVMAFRWLHPDLGLRLVHHFSRLLANRTRTPDRLEEAARAQAAYATALMAQRPALDVVIMGHTHRAAVERVGARRWYLNPGAWMEGRCYALLGPEGPELRTFKAG